MKAEFNLTKILNCELEILGLETEKGYYSDTTSFANKEFIYTDLTTINIVYKVDSKETENLNQIFINIHTIDSEGNNSTDLSTYTFTEDGLYKVSHLLIPTKDWMDRFIESGTSEQAFMYATDGTKYYKLSGGTITETTLTEILEINSEADVNFYREDIYTFSICNLMTCYYNICRALLNEVCDTCDSNTSYSYERDVLWMVINVIKYLIEKGSFFEAQRILESVTGCTGFCNNNNDKKDDGCGCNSRN